MGDTWTIGELAERAADALRAHTQPVNGRVREVPGERLIRWYTTIGLVDPPLTRRGRIAQYGRRHLLQLVAVKRMQAAGRSIADIQAALTGATDAMLEAAAHPAPDPLAPALPAPDLPELAEGAGRERFWAARDEAGRVEAGDVAAGRTEKAVEAQVWGVKVGQVVTVLVEGGSRRPTEDDIEAVRAAAAPLLAVLEDRELA